MRKPRMLKEGAKYHVSAKINRGEHIFEEDQVKNLFLEIVRRSKKKYKFTLNNFIIMGNHIHLFIIPHIRRNNIYSVCLYEIKS